MNAIFAAHLDPHSSPGAQILFVVVMAVAALIIWRKK
jgi:hypothetical protein